jgi:hypothetical protein
VNTRHVEAEVIERADEDVLDVMGPSAREREVLDMLNEPSPG